MKAVLILGAGVMQGPAIHLARQKGYRVYVADGKRDSEHAATADQFLHIDLKDHDALLEAATGIDNLAGVFTAGTDFSASVAWVSQHLGLPGIPFEAALDASDKSRMRRRLAAAGVPVPAFATGGGGDDPALLLATLAGANGLSLPVVVKPVDNMGARGCRLVRNRDGLAAAWTDAVAHSRTGRAIMEEYLAGPEFSLDAIITDGQVTIRGIADRYIHFEPYFIEMGHTMPSAYGPEVLEAVADVFMRGIQAIGITQGAAKGDIKFTKEGAFVGEIAARLSGGYMSGWTYPYASGIEVTAEALDIACGVKPVPATPTRQWVCAERAFISIPGKVAEIRGLAEAAATTMVRDCFVRIQPGSKVRFPVNNVEKCGNVIAAGPDRLAVEDAAAGAAASFLIRLAAEDPDTAEFLEHRGQYSSWPPDAYQDLSALGLAAVAAMPDFIRFNAPYRSISIEPVPHLMRESAKDWQGRSIQSGLAAVEALTGAAVGRHGDIIVGRRFWKAFSRGAYQGGAWVIDRVKAGLERP